MKYIVMAALCCLMNSIASAEGLSLGEYIENVKKSNDNLNALEIRTKALKEMQAEAELLYATKFESTVGYTDDQRPTTSAAFQGNQTKLKTGKMGVQKNNSYGTNFSVSYNVSQTQLNGASPELVPQNIFHENFVKAEFSQSLLRNALGHEIRARENLIRNNSKSSILNQKYRTEVLIADAENLYYQLLIATESFNIQVESLKRAQSIELYTRRRLKKNLGDKTDYLQAKAALKQREYDLQVAKDEKRKIAQMFNSYRGINSSDLSRKPEIQEIKKIEGFNFNAKSEHRLDTQASKFSLETEKAQQKINLEALRPDLNLTGSASFYGRQSELNEALNDSLSSDNPVYTIGLNFTVPLDFSSTKKAKSAYRLNISAAEKEYQRKVFEEKNEWINLKSLYHETSQQLKILNELEVIQKNKLENEIKQQKRGRSTTFQVLSFEQEYLSILLRKIQLKSNLAKTYTQLKLFI